MHKENMVEFELTPEDEQILDEVWKEVVAREKSKRVVRVIKSVRKLE